MRPDNWHLTEDVDDLLARAGGFLRSRPALHTMPLTATETLRAGGTDTHAAEPPVFGRLETGGQVCAVFYRVPPRRLILTSLTPGQADALAAHLAGLGHPLPGVSADHQTATAFAEAWQRHTGATPTLLHRLRLYRLGTLIPPQPSPEGRPRVAGEHDREQLRLWCNGFAQAVGQAPFADVESWARRYAHKRFTFWETPDGTPVSIAGTTSLIAGQIRVDPVYTPADLGGRGYAGAVTVAASRAALAAGATEVVLFTNLANPSSNSLYQRIGYRPVTDFAMYDFSGAASEIRRGP
jgi:predicted GNAT family acetyltransferase